MTEQRTFWAQFHNGTKGGAITFEVIDVALCGTELRLKLPNEEWYFVDGGDIVGKRGDPEPFIDDWHVNGKDWSDFGCAGYAYPDMQQLSREEAMNLEGLTQQ